VILSVGNNDNDKVPKMEVLEDDTTDINSLLQQYLSLGCSESDNGEPSSLLDCMVGVSLDVAKYLQYSAKESELDEMRLKLSIGMLKLQNAGGQRKQAKKQQVKQRAPRRYKSLAPYYFDDNGIKICIRPRHTAWYMMYVKNPALDSDKFNKKFRRRFRMSHQQFVRLLARVQGHESFKRWLPSARDAFGARSSPIELLLLGALRYLGRGLTFDDLEEYTAINEETHRQFFHKFIEYGSSVLHDELVKMPQDSAAYAKSRKQYDIGGLTGAGFSTDATNVVMWRCSHNLRQANMGFKQSHPARTYNLTCNHNRRILYTTKGHPSRWNDKTLAHFDEFLCAVREGKILQDVEFQLYSWEGPVGASCLESTKYCGAWGLVDNGYHKWSCTQAPAKHCSMRTEQRLSEWIESFRKDAECTFGILKGRFRVLKTGIRLDGPEAADRVWLTCCALHNFLLEEDGLDDWNGDIGCNDITDLRYAPFALQRLTAEEYCNFGSRQHEQQSILQEYNDRRWDAIEEQEDFAEEEEETGEAPHIGGVHYGANGCIVVNSLSYNDFRNRLVEHFDILHRKQQVRWPFPNQHKDK
jgi:DDE superfamily endonuclease